MNRRQLLVVGGIAFSAVAMSLVSEPAIAASTRKPPPFDLMIQPATEVLLKGQNCLSYCIYQLGEGMKELATVARNVNELLVMAQAVQSLAQQHGRQMAALVPLAMAAAEVCVNECLKFAQGHAAVKDCADGCAAFIKAGKQFEIEYAEFQRGIAAS